MIDKEYAYPKADVRAERPENYRTIYVLYPHYGQNERLPLRREPDIGDFYREEAGFPREGTQLNLTGMPERVSIFRYADVGAGTDLFADCHLGAEISESDPIPDILDFYGSLLISRKLKDLFERYDPEGKHQFVRCKMIGVNGEELSELEFYHFVCGRIALLFDHQKRRDLIRCNVSDAYSARIFDNLERARFMSTLPIWSSLAKDVPLKFSQEIWEKLSTHDLLGFKQYYDYAGIRERSNTKGDLEAVGQMWVDMTD